MNTDQWTAILRQLLTFGGGFVVAKGWVDQTTMMAVVGAIVTIGSTVWSIVVHTNTSKIAAAAALPEVSKVIAPSVANSTFADNTKVTTQ